MSILGYDISNVNGPEFVFPDDAEFVIAKVTQDAVFVDKEFSRHRDHARSLNIPFGGYHYADLKQTPDPERSLWFFLENLGDQDNGEFAALDAEQDFGLGGLDPGDERNLPWVKNWGLGFIKAKNYKPKLYIGNSAITELGLNSIELPEIYDLWYAWWSNDKTPDNPPESPAPWNDPMYAFKLWQYNADDIDKNAFLGTAAELRSTGARVTAPEIDYETTYWTPIMTLMNQMIANPTHGHADRALHAAISNSITLHKIIYGAESRD